MPIATINTVQFHHMTSDIADQSVRIMQKH